MGRIVSGGLKTSPPIERQSQIPVQNQPQQQSEGFLSRVGRNIAKAPFGLAAGAASGFGIGDLINYINQKGQNIVGDTSNLQGPENTRSAFPAQRLAPNILKALTNPQTSIPTRQQASGGIQSLLSEGLSPEIGKYLTESRPGDYPYELGAQHLPFAAASLLSGGLPALGQYAALSTGAHIGGAAGRHVGGAIGEQLGNRELGETIGEIPALILGAKAGKALANRPLKTLSPKVGATQAERHAALEAPYTKSGFEKAKHQQIKAVRSEIKQYDNTIKKLDARRKPAYDAAKALEGNSRGPATIVTQAIKDIESDLLAGVNPVDAKKIRESIGSLEESIHRNKGNLSLSDAKKFQKNYNDQIYNFSESLSFKRQLRKAANALNEFIKETGSPEHYNEWIKAETATKELKALQAERPEFLTGKKNEISDLSKEKFSDTSFGRSKTSQLLKALSQGVKLGGRELKHLYNVFKNDKDVYKKYAQFLKETPGFEKAVIAKTITPAHEKEVSKEQVKTRRKGIVSGGLKF